MIYEDTNTMIYDFLYDISLEEDVSLEELILNYSTLY